MELNNEDVSRANLMIAEELTERAKRMDKSTHEMPALIEYDKNTIESPKQKYFYSVDDFLNLPPLEYLIAGHITQKGFTGLIGQPGHGKSFLALDIACCVSSGINWHGHDTKQGSVIYVVAEGEDGFKDRIKAWINGHPEIDHDLLKRNLKFVPRAIQLTETEEINELLENLDNLEPQPLLVIIDTLARCNLGNDENSSRDMGLFIDGCNKIQGATGGSVLVVHHPNKDGFKERGSGALRGAADTMMNVSMSANNAITLDCTKSKNSVHFKKKHFRFRDDTESQSVYIELVTETQNDSADDIGKNERAVLKNLKSLGGNWFFMREIKALMIGMSDSTVERSVKSLANNGQLEAEGENKHRRYRVPTSDLITADKFDELNPFTPS